MWVYILKCVPEIGEWEFYVGYTTDLKARIKKHACGATKTTRRFREVKLVYYEASLSAKDSRKREKQLKTGFGRGYVNKRLEDYLKRD
ncbi:MAG: GIY-YIG nuclease family protein [Candidatus Vogelbacteria bacterium]|nr:GIY-YIG nuclease family protein [Candidatus Vogelbacteria bacterium]